MSQPIRMQSGGGVAFPVFDDDLLSASFDSVIEGAPAARAAWTASNVEGAAAQRAYTLALRQAREDHPEADYVDRETWLHTTDAMVAPLAAEVLRLTRQSQRLLLALDALTRSGLREARKVAATQASEANARCRTAYRDLAKALADREEACRVAGIAANGYASHPRFGGVTGYSSQMDDLAVVVERALTRSVEQSAEYASRVERILKAERMALR